MKTERVFLMELFLDEELPKKIKLMIKDRFQEMEEKGFEIGNARVYSQPVVQDFAPIANQSPSMQKIMASNPDLIPAPKPPTPTTVAAAKALEERQNLINNAIKGKENGKSARKM